MLESSLLSEYALERNFREEEMLVLPLALVCLVSDERREGRFIAEACESVEGDGDVLEVDV